MLFFHLVKHVCHCFLRIQNTKACYWKITILPFLLHLFRFTHKQHKNCAENNEFSSHILRWITILLRHDVYKRSSTKWPKKRLKRGQNRQISLGFPDKVNVTPRKCQLKYNSIFFKKNAFQNAVAMTTLNGLNNDMSELLQGLTSIVRFREMSILWVRPK